MVNPTKPARRANALAGIADEPIELRSLMLFLNPANAAAFKAHLDSGDSETAVALEELLDALNLKAPLASPTFTGVPAAPTAAVSENSTQIATTAFVKLAVAAARIVFASTVCALDSNISTGGGTDCRAALQAVLDTASASNPLRLVVDGVGLLSAGLQIGSHTTIEGITPACGFFLQSGANMPIIWNKASAAADAAADSPPEIMPLPSAGSEENVTLRNLTLNHNGVGQSDWGAGHHNPMATYLCGIKRLHMENIRVLNSRAWTFCMQGLEDFTFSNLIAEHPEDTDGWHYGGGLHLMAPMRRIRGAGLRILNGTDDAIALTHPDGSPGGDIEDVVIHDVEFDHCDTGIKFEGQSGAGHMTRNVHFSNVRGTVTGLLRGSPDAISNNDVGAMADVTMLGWDVRNLDGDPAELNGFTPDNTAYTGLGAAGMGGGGGGGSFDQSLNTTDVPVFASLSVESSSDSYLDVKQTGGSKTRIYGLSSGGGFQIDKDAALTKAWSVGMGLGGIALDDDLVFPFYNGVAWAEAIRFSSDSGLKIRGGASLKKMLAASATLDFPNTTAQTSSDLTISVSGAVLGDSVALGVPHGSVNANSDFSAWVSASNTVTVRFSNFSTGSINPASGVFKVSVFQF